MRHRPPPPRASRPLTPRPSPRALTPRALALLALALLTASPLAHAQGKRETIGAPYFEELRARAQSAFDELDERIDDEFEGGAEREAREEAAREAREAREQAAREAREAREEAAREARDGARAEAAREAREEAERAIARAEERRAAAEQGRQREEARRHEAERAAAEERRARLLAEQARAAASAPAPAPALAPAPGRYAREMAEVLALVNAERARGGSCGGQRFEPTPPLAPNAQLDAAAQVHAEAMERERFFDHRDPRGEGPRDRIAAQGYSGRAWGENIAAGQRTPQSVVRAWMESPGHCKNILNGLFTELGVGVLLGARGEYGTYWVQNFGRR
ncbi:MAG: CAP domain-containing protein [Deltaproteobacteria bacterium]|nr:CAP domain-containing protein [Deltaproteobacteria bacterium]